MPIGRVFQGIADGIRRKKENDRQKELLPLQKTLLQYQVQKAKTEQQREATRQKFLDLVIQRLGPGGQNATQGTAQSPDTTTQDGPQFAESFEEKSGPGLVDQMLLSDPTLSAIIKSETGVDLLGASRATESQRHNRILEQAAKRRLEQQTRSNDIRERSLEGGYKFIDVEQPGGGRKKVAVPKILGGGVPNLSIQTNRPTRQKPIPEKDLPLWINTQSLETPSVGMSPENAQEQGFKRITTGQREKLTSLGSVGEILSKVEKLMGEVFPQTETFLGRVGGAIKRKTGAVTQTNTNAAQLNKLLQGTLAPVVRALGEKGALSDTDIKRAIALFPNLTDDADVAWGALQQIKEIIQDAKNQALGVSGQVDMVYNPKTGTLEPAQ